MNAAGGVRVGVDGGWLAAVIPEHARTFRVSDRALAETLVDGGAELVDTEPDVEIVSRSAPRGDAAFAVVSINLSQREGGGKLERGARRLERSLRVRASAARMRRQVEDRGYSATSIVLWDVDQFVHLPDSSAHARRRLSELLPQRALVIGSRSPSRTLLQAVADEAAEHLGQAIQYELPLARQGLTIALTEDHVLRVAVGPGRRKIDLQNAALEQLSDAQPPKLVRERAPWPLAAGKLGLANWSIERRLPGRPASSKLTARVLEECIDFLVALHELDGQSYQTPLSEAAAIVSEACRRPSDAGALLRLGHELDSQLAGLPCGFGHGDFWARNVLVEGGRLAGVIDWDAAGPGRLLLLDLLHLGLSLELERTREYLGAAVVRHQLPWARAGGDEFVASYCQRLGVRIEADVLEKLVVASWLTRAAFEVGMFADRVERPLWIQHNVELVLDSLSA